MIDMSLKYPGLSKQNALAVTMLLICVAAMYNWFISPHIQYLAAAQKYQEVMESTEKTSKILSSDLKLRQKKLDELTQQFELQKQGFFDIDQAKIFLSEIQSIAEKSGCLVSNLKLSPARAVPVKNRDSIDIRQYQTEIGLLGNYGNIIKFLNTIQKRNARVWINSIDVGMKHAESGYLGCNITFSIYTLKVKENTSNVDNTQK
ncbi:MAG: hypothetical protein WC496_08025 [Phycisphaerae bacterium]|jgi:Tfp pilus assembly protein PilO